MIFLIIGFLVVIFMFCSKFEQHKSVTNSTYKSDDYVSYDQIKSQHMGDWDDGERYYVEVRESHYEYDDEGEYDYGDDGSGYSSWEDAKEAVDNINQEREANR